MNIHRIPLINCDEYDAFTAWKNILIFKAGDRKKIKRKYRKRLRQKVKDWIANELNEYYKNA